MLITTDISSLSFFAVVVTVVVLIEVVTEVVAEDELLVWLSVELPDVLPETDEVLLAVVFSFVCAVDLVSIG